MFERTCVLLALSIALLTATGCGLRGAADPARLDAEQLYTEAQASMASRNYASAIRYLQQLERRFPFSLEAQQGQLELIYAHYRNGDHEQAEAAADRFVREQPRHPDMDYAHYLRGLINFDRSGGFLDGLFNIDLARRDVSTARSSYQSFQMLVTSFPESRYVPDARQRMVYLRNRIARHEIHIADYYMKIGAWVAAVGRAKTVVEQYDETPSVVDGLVILHNAYRQLQLDDLADDIALVLAANYPEAQGRLQR